MNEWLPSVVKVQPVLYNFSLLEVLALVWLTLALTTTLSFHNTPFQYTIVVPIKKAFHFPRFIYTEINNQTTKLSPTYDLEYS